MAVKRKNKNETKKDQRGNVPLRNDIRFDEQYPVVGWEGVLLGREGIHTLMCLQTLAKMLSFLSDV